MQPVEEPIRSGSYGRPRLRAMATGESSRLRRGCRSARRVGRPPPRPSSAAIARASSRSRLAPSSPAVRINRSRRSSSSARFKVRGTRPPRARERRMFSTRALARELTCSPLTNAMSDAITPGPRRGRSTTPGNSTLRPRSLTSQREPSEAYEMPSWAKNVAFAISFRPTCPKQPPDRPPHSLHQPAVFVGDSPHRQLHFRRDLDPGPGVH